MFLNSFNSIYLRPTGSGTINGWDDSTAQEKHWDNINDLLYFDGNIPPRANYGSSPPSEVVNLSHSYVGTRDGLYVTHKTSNNASPNYFGHANSGQIQSWRFEKPQYDGSGQLNIWLYTTSVFTISNWLTSIIAYNKLDGQWVPKQIDSITLFDTFFNPAQTGVFRWYKIPIGMYSSGSFLDYEVGLGFTTNVTSSPFRNIEALYAEIEFEPFPLYISGAYPTSSNNIPLYIQTNDVDGSLPLYTFGEALPVSGDISLYTFGIGTSYGEIPLYISGVPNEISGGIPFYTCGPLPVESGLGFILYNNNPLTTGLNFYTKGYGESVSGVDLYTFGAYLSQGSIPLVVSVPTGTQSNLPLYVGGFVPTPSVSSLPLSIYCDDPFREDGWTSYNALYDYYDTYIPISKNRVKYGTPPFDSSLTYSGIYNFFRPHIASGVQHTYYEPSRAIWSNNIWQEGMFVSGVISLGSPTGFNIAVLLPNDLYDIDDATYFFTPYIPNVGDVTSSVLHEPFTQYLEEYFDPYNIIDFKSFVDNYLSVYHSGYKKSIDTWNGNIVVDLSTPQTYFLTTMSGSLGIWPALPVSAYWGAVSGAIAYVESLTNPHHPYTFSMYTAGANISSKGATLYTKGLSYSSSGSIPLFTKVSLDGQANVKDTYNSLPLYVGGLGIKGSSFRGIDLYIQNNQPHLPLSGTFTLYVQSEQPVYSTEDSIPLVVYNNIGGVYSGVPLYIKNVREGVSIFDPEYFTLADNAYPLGAGRTLYLHNNLNEGSIPLFLKVVDSFSGGVPLYVGGGYIGQTGVPLYMKSLGVQTDTLNLYSHGY